MKKTIILLAVSGLFTAITAQNAKKTSFDLGVTSDPFFGNTIMGLGGVAVDDKLKINGYGIFWNNVNGVDGNGFGLASEPWTEFGGGITYQLTPELAVTPLLGVLSGDLQSLTGTATPGEAIVPNLTMNYLSSSIEANYYGGYYKTLSAGRANGGQQDYVHMWGSIGYLISPYLSLGAYWEELHAVAQYDADGNSVSANAIRGANNRLFYQWLGGYTTLKFPDSNGAFIRLAAGIDTTIDSDGFYKMSMGMSF